MNNPSPRKYEEKVHEFSYPIIETIRLDSLKNVQSKDFFNIIEKRRSIRKFKKILVKDLSDLLWVSSKVQHIHLQENGYILTQRPSPSAGARHPLDLIISSPTLSSNDTLFYYNPFDHSINRLNLDKEICESLHYHTQQILSESSDATTIWLIAHKDRTQAKYQNADSLIWRDAGAIIYCIQIVCSALGLNSCQIGTLGHPYIEKLFKASGKVIGAGCVLIGK